MCEVTHWTTIHYRSLTDLRWLAPNLITFLGFICVVVVALLTSWYDYHWLAAGGPGQQNLRGYIPNYVFTLSAVLIFLAYNLDGIDGKQARRLGVSGPLGEMFDHGLDSYIVFFIPFCLFSVFGRDEFSIPLFRCRTLRVVEPALTSSHELARFAR
ncbi:Ethanolaminephosphotransferase 1 [Papilio xuthus]|uniref:Ethanolaminephosphotransferase 1 n=1 Tax=Papilio xuthus TaxID=66420 RepID=A0A0N1PGZ6_PAPXU|nr:Ethanolaminephosphotransferase 1 [Papilio xuthus]